MVEWNTCSCGDRAFSVVLKAGGTHCKDGVEDANRTKSQGFFIAILGRKNGTMYSLSCLFVCVF